MYQMWYNISMKGSLEHKRYLQKYKKELKKCHYDDLYLFKLERCIKKYTRKIKHPKKEF